MTRSTRPVAGRNAGILALGLALALVPAVPAHAHDPVIDTIPGQGQVLTELPPAFTVTTNQPMLALGTGGAFAIQVTDAAGAFYGTGCVEVSGSTMSTPGVLGEAGTYTMSYQYVSSDGHTTSGTVVFEWRPPAGFEPGYAWDHAPACGETPPTPTPDPEPEPEPSTTATEPPGASGDDPLTPWLWALLGALVVASAAIAVVVARRRSTTA